MDVIAPSPACAQPLTAASGKSPNGAAELTTGVSPNPPAVRRRVHPRIAERERERDARRARARQKAVHLLHEALSRAKGGDSGLAEAVLQIAKHLDVERCDLLELGTPHGGGSTGVLYRVRQPRPTPAAPPEPEAPMPATEAPTTARRRGKRRASNDGPVAIEAVQIATQQSPLDLLRSEGMVDRVHVFIARPSGGDLLGILSVQNSTSRRLSIDERAFLDAVADLIALAIERRVLISADELLATAAQFE